MRQLRIQEPWADLAFAGSEKQKLDDLVARIQMLEARVRELEIQVAERSSSRREEIPVGV